MSEGLQSVATISHRTYRLPAGSHSVVIRDSGQHPARAQCPFRRNSCRTGRPAATRTKTTNTMFASLRHRSMPVNTPSVVLIPRCQGTRQRLPVFNRRKAGMTSSPHGLDDLYTPPVKPRKWGASKSAVVTRKGAKCLRACFQIAIIVVRRSPFTIPMGQKPWFLARRTAYVRYLA